MLRRRAPLRRTTASCTRRTAPRGDPCSAARKTASAALGVVLRAVLDLHAAAALCLRWRQLPACDLHDLRAGGSLLAPRSRAWMGW